MSSSRTLIDAVSVALDSADGVVAVSLLESFADAGLNADQAFDVVSAIRPDATRKQWDALITAGLQCT